MPTRPAPDLATTACALRQWAIESVLPFWATTGFDARSGGFHERLLPDGRPDTAAVRRLRVQARQIYVYAHAATLGWFPDGTRLALLAFDTLVDRYRSPDGAAGFARAVNRDGVLDDPLRDTYDHAFLLLALGWLARASGDAQVRAMIDEVLGFLDEHLAAGDGTCHEGLPRSLPRRQNPHMHLLEAMLALHETVRHPQALERAAGLRALLDTHFLSPATGTLTEFFDEDWRAAPLGQPVEPGHHAEWSWLVRRHARMAGLAVSPVADSLLDFASRAADRATGLLPELSRADGAPVSTTYRCWAQTEFAKALLARCEDGATGAAASAAIALDRVRQRYLTGPVAGAWAERLDGAGAPITDFIPASSLYHLFCAIAEADRIAGAFPALMPQRRNDLV